MIEELEYCIYHRELIKKSNEGIVMLNMLAIGIKTKDCIADNLTSNKDNSFAANKVLLD